MYSYAFFSNCLRHTLYVNPVNTLAETKLFSQLKSFGFIYLCCYGKKLSESHPEIKPNKLIDKLAS